jgi:hypothetical protein
MSDPDETCRPFFTIPVPWLRLPAGGFVDFELPEGTFDLRCRRMPQCRWLFYD